jgi:IQ calmodulin-binding motif
LFNDNDFIDEKSVTPAQKYWLSQVLKTQLFQRFLEIRLEDPNDASVLFFDESVIAKNNRSVKKSLKQGKITTPFLDNPSWKISDVFTPPAPSNWGLPADGRLYSYSRFPKLNKSLYGTARMKKRWPPEWEQKVERKLGTHRALTMKRNAMLQSAYMSARSQALMSKLNSTNGEFVPTLLTNQGRNPRERNLSWAIRILTDKNVEESIRDDMDDITNNSSIRSQHNERLTTRSVRQNIAAESIILAQEILLASRRKQGILLSIVVEFQRRTIRLATKPASQTQSVTLPCIENPVKTSQIVVIQKRVRGFVILQRHRKKITSAICIQKSYRHRRQLQFIKRIKGVTLLQSWWRGEVSRRRAMKRASSIKKLQALVRGATARFAFGMIINEVIRIQAQVRAYLVRRNSLSLLQQLSARYRDQIFYLWTRSHAPLSYRAQMWCLFQASFLGIRIMIDELERLWTMLEIQGASNENLSKDSFLQKLESRGFSTRFEQKFVNMSYVIMNVRDQSSNMEFPGEKSSLGVKHASRIAAERLQIYERLNKLSKPDSEAIYEHFGISPKSKKKKLHTLEKLWESPLFTDESTNLMLTLFPELKESTDIKQVMASRKGLNRFHSSQKHSLLDPLDREFCVGQKLDTLFRKNMTEVAMAGLRRIPARSTPLTKSCTSMRTSSQFSCRTKDERATRRATMQKFLYNDYNQMTSSLSEWS